MKPIYSIQILLSVILLVAWIRVGNLQSFNMIPFLILVLATIGVTMFNLSIELRK